MTFLKKMIKFWILLAAIFGCVYFALNNQEVLTVRITPLLTLPPLPAYLVFVGFTLLGAAIVSLFFTWHVTSRSVAHRKTRKRLKQLEKEQVQTTTNTEDEYYSSSRDNLSH